MSSSASMRGRPNYRFCVSQGSAATAHIGKLSKTIVIYVKFLHDVAHQPSNIKIGHCFTELAYQKITLALILSKTRSSFV